MSDPTPLSIVQGATYNASLVWATDDVPNSLAPYRAHMQFRRRLNQSGTPVVDLSSETDSPPLILEPGGETGKLEIRIPADQTELLSRPTYYYDLFIVERDHPDTAVRLLHGTATISPSVTVNASATP
jgi:hypothetical protein